MPDGGAALRVNPVDIQNHRQWHILPAHERRVHPIPVPLGHLANKGQHRRRALQARHGKQHVAIHPAIPVRMCCAAQALR